jgi:hypothetical protein
LASPVCGANDELGSLDSPCPDPAWQIGRGTDSQKTAKLAARRLSRWIIPIQQDYTARLAIVGRKNVYGLDLLGLQGATRVL